MSKTIERRAIEWALGDDTGSSSEALCRFMLGISPSGGMPPSDAGDRGRCIRLLKLIPEWIPRLKELNGAVAPDILVMDQHGVHRKKAGWAEQIPLIISEGKL